MVVHIGVVVVAVALAASNSYLHQSELTVAPGETAYVSGHEIVFVGTQEKVFDNKTKVEAVVLVDGSVVRPGVSRFANGGIVRTPGTKSSPVRDIQVAVLDLPDGPGGPAGLRVNRAAAYPVAVDRRRNHAAGRGVLGLPRSPPLTHPAGVGAGTGSSPARRLPSRRRSASWLSSRLPPTSRSNSIRQSIPISLASRRGCERFGGWCWLSAFWLWP